MRKYFVLGVELIIIAFVAGTMLTCQPLWTKPAPVGGQTATLGQSH